MLSLLPSLLTADDRPTGDEVAKAVEASRDKYRDDHPTPAFIRDLQNKINKLRRERGEALKGKTSEERKAILEEYSATIDTMTTRMAAAKLKLRNGQIDEYFILPANLTDESREEMNALIEKAQLARLDWTRLKVGAVGWVGPEETNLFTGGIRCIQRLPDGRWLGERIIGVGSGFAAVPGMSKSQGVVIVDGVKTDPEGKTILDGGIYYLYFNAVVTGEYTYTTVAGASRTVFVIEKFDPDKRFE